MLKLQPKFSAPIPGQALTQKLGSRPWQRPPQYSTVDKAVKYYVERFQIDEVEDSILDVLGSGVPVPTIANSLQLGSVMEGKHSIDVGLLVLPILMEMLMYIGDKHKVKYETGFTNKKKEVRGSTINRAIKELKEEAGQEPTEQKEQEEKIPMMEEPKGLMARRDNNV